MNSFLAFFERDLRVEISYRLSFIWTFVGIFISVFMFYYMAQLMGSAASPYLQDYGGNYFAFLLIGIAFSRYLNVALNSFSNSIRSAQRDGTLEAMLITPTPISIIAFGSSLWSYTRTTFDVLVYLIIGKLFLNVNLQGNLLAAVLTLGLSMAAFSAIGVIGASIVLVIKQGDPVVWVFGTVASLLGGVYYPVAVLPGWIQALAKLLPVTYALHALRLALLQGASVIDVASDLAILCGFCLVLIPLSIYTFRIAMYRARLDGSLAHF
jgi:ABC-2 type transport system permease protein